MSSFTVKNNAESLVTNDPLAQAAVTLNVTPSDGALFPSTFPFLITIWDENAHPDPSNDAGMEICRCTARTDDAITIVRGQESTSDVAHTLGERVAMLITAGIFNDGTYGVSTKLDGITPGAIADIVEDTTPQLGGTLDSNSKQIRWSKGSDVASANGLTLGDDGNYFDITGTTSITSIGTKAIGMVAILHFDGILTLTYNATDLILPSGANITTAAGDEATFVEYATGDWRCISYTKANGEAVVGGGTKEGVVRLPAEGAYLPDTNPAALVEVLGSGAYPGYSTANFDDGTQEFAEWYFPMPDYDLGNITVVIKWLCSATSGNVGWIIESIGVAHDENFTQAVVGDAATITAVTAASAITDLNTTTYTTYDPAGVAADDMVKFRIKRNVAVDTMVGDAKLLECLLIYQKT